jgi:hypothetical protein
MKAGAFQAGYDPAGVGEGVGNGRQAAVRHLAIVIEVRRQN